jgi:hypothetical protein
MGCVAHGMVVDSALHRGVEVVGFSGITARNPCMTRDVDSIHRVFAMEPLIQT